MALINGKQILNDSLGIIKLKNDGAQGTITFGAGTVIGLTDAPTNGTDLANKDYVDGIAAGLDPKESVRVASIANIASLSGLTSVDGYTLEDGDRILVKEQTDLTENGIYTASTGTWGRAADSDGSPANEVTLGNFTFVETGSTHAGQGWVLRESDATDPDTAIVPDTDTQEWTQFSESTSFTAGNGIDISNTVISSDADEVTLTATGGTGDQLAIVKLPNDLSAGTGLSFDSGSEFNGAVARTINLDDTAVTAGSYGDAGTIPTFGVDAQGRLTAATDVAISILASQVSDFATSAETAIFTTANFVDSSTIDFTVTAGDSVTAGIIDESISERHLNATNAPTDNYILSYDDATSGFTWVDVNASDTVVTGGTYNASTDTITFTDSNASTFDVTGVTDTVLTGGTYDNGSGDITFTNNDGSTVVVDLSSLDLNDTVITGGTVSNGSLVLTDNDDNNVNVTGTIIQSLSAEQGLTASTTNGAITIGIDIDGVDDTHINFGTGATQVNAADLPIIDSGGNFTASTTEEALAELQDNIDAVDTAIITNVATDKNVTALVTTADTAQAMTQAIVGTPLGYVQVFINGALQNMTGDKVGDCYFSNDGGTTARALGAIVSSDTLHWNGSVAGFELATTDKVTLIYET